MRIDDVRALHDPIRNRLSGTPVPCIPALSAACCCLLLMMTGCTATPENTILGPTIAGDCKELASYSSLDSVNRLTLDFRNERSTPITLSWVNYQGEEEDYGSIEPGEQRTVNTFITHPWVLRDDTGQCIAAYISDYTTTISVH